MSYTTNTATAESPTTYDNLARECEQMAVVARRMATIASERLEFREDDEFRRLMTEFRALSLNVHSLQIAI